MFCAYRYFLVTVYTIQQLLLLIHPFNGLFSRTTWVSRHRKVNHSAF